MRAAMMVLVLLASGCSAQGGEEPSQESSLSLLAALGMAQGLQHRADELEMLGDVSGAVTEVERVLTIAFPEGDDREDVRLDAYGRIAELELGRGEVDAALEAIERGRSEASRDSYFHARLLLTLGRVQQARAAARRAAGDDEGARQASLEAVTTLEESIAMNQRVLTSLSNSEASP